MDRRLHDQLGFQSPSLDIIYILCLFKHEDACIIYTYDVYHKMQKKTKKQTNNYMYPPERKKKQLIIHSLAKASSS